MSLTLALAVQARLTAQIADPLSPLAAWGAEHGAEPLLTLGYRRPTGAQGWPYLALEPVGDERDLWSGRALSGAIALACGYRLAQVERGAGDGILAVEALADAVWAALRRPWRAPWGRENWEARIARRTAVLFTHPTYEVEWALEFGRVGIDPAPVDSRPAGRG